MPTKPATPAAPTAISGGQIAAGASLSRPSSRLSKVSAGCAIDDLPFALQRFARTGEKVSAKLAVFYSDLENFFLCIAQRL
jgi:hypothetical protein